jgi:CRISPR-associated Csx11 family protein
MSNNIDALTTHRDDLLKAEIAIYFILLDKTNINFWKGKGYFDGLEKVNFSFDDFLNTFFLKNHKIDFFDDNNQLKSYNLIDDLLKNWRSAQEPLQKILARGCENVNSGIDKGALPDSQRIKGKLYISNAFGSFMQKMDHDYLDKRRECFLQRLHNELSQKDFYANPNWQEIRNFVSNEIKCWYSNLLSDSRFPANDVTLWDQAYMTASMFKATLADCYLQNNATYKIKNPQLIQWRILGIQYDKLSLAEKASKPAIIAAYRNECLKFDEQVKAYLEKEIALGNEIYRDETGIYFLVPESLPIKKYDTGVSIDLLKEENIINEINQRAYDIFHNEVQPVYVLSKASRGTMNLTQLLEHAPELRLYAPRFGQPRPEKKPSSSQICRVCRVRFANNQNNKEKENNEIPLCETCKKRKINRLNTWNTNRNEETIWLGELQDKNSRIALLTIRFELKQWLNGNMLSSLLNRKEKFDEEVENLKSIILSIRDYQNRFEQRDNKNLLEFIAFYENNKAPVEQYLNLFDEKGIKKQFKKVIDKSENLLNNQKLNDEDRNIINLLNRFWKKFFRCNFSLLKEKKDGKVVNKNDKTVLDQSNFKLNKDSYKRFKNYYQSDGKKLTFKDIFAFSFLTNNVIGGLILDRSNGTTWQKLIKEKIGIVDSIDWANLTDKQIDEMSSILIQFLLRKNPSPARLRRIWESTQRFTNEIKADIANNLSAKRIVWDVVKGEGSYQNNEIEINGLLFYLYEGKAFLITSLASCFKQIYNFKNKEIKNFADWIKSENYEISDFELPEKIEIDENEIEISNPQFENFQSYVSLLDPTPISWQVAVPADKVPKLIKMIQEKYKKHFHYVYGKLPLHIGVVVQNFKHPLYIGLQALRNIRREVRWEDIKSDIDGIRLKAIQKDQVTTSTSEEIANCAETYYSFFIRKDTKGDYQFYFPPEKVSKHLSLTNETGKGDIFFYYPNTIDFEFLDCNTRRNDIFYEKGKRKPEHRQQRPLTWEHWYKYTCFRELFADDSSKLHNLISLFYRLLQDWKNEEKNILQLAATAIINMLQPQNMSNRKKAILACLFGAEKWKDINEKIEIKHLLEFIDYYDFWHNNLKEV